MGTFAKPWGWCRWGWGVRGGVNRVVWLLGLYVPSTSWVLPRSEPAQGLCHQPCRVVPALLSLLPLAPQFPSLFTGPQGAQVGLCQLSPRQIPRSLDLDPQPGLGSDKAE